MAASGSGKPEPMRLALLTLLFLVAGCGAGGSTAYVNVTIDEMKPLDLDALVTTGLNRENEIMLVKRNPADAKTLSSDLMFVFTEYHYSGEMGYLRNPDAVVAILKRNPDAKALTDKDREMIDRIARDKKLEIVPSFKLEAVVGPDGKTPKVMPLKTSLKSAHQPGTIMSILAFPTEKAAREAKLYIHEAYKVEIRHEPKPPFKPFKPGDEPPPGAGKDWSLIATLKADTTASNVEMDEFTRLAEKFGGVLLSTNVY